MKKKMDQPAAVERSVKETPADKISFVNIAQTRLVTENSSASYPRTTPPRFIKPTDAGPKLVAADIRCKLGRGVISGAANCRG